MDQRLKRVTQMLPPIVQWRETPLLDVVTLLCPLGPATKETRTTTVKGASPCRAAAGRSPGQPRHRADGPWGLEHASACGDSPRSHRSWLTLVVDSCRLAGKQVQTQVLAQVSLSCGTRPRASNTRTSRRRASRRHVTRNGADRVCARGAHWAAPSFIRRRMPNHE